MLYWTTYWQNKLLVGVPRRLNKVAYHALGEGKKNKHMLSIFNRHPTEGGIKTPQNYNDGLTPQKPSAYSLTVRAFRRDPHNGTWSAERGRLIWSVVTPPANIMWCTERETKIRSPKASIPCCSAALYNSSTTLSTTSYEVYLSQDAIISFLNLCEYTTTTQRILLLFQCYAMLPLPRDSPVAIADYYYYYYCALCLMFNVLFARRLSNLKKLVEKAQNIERTLHLLHP